MIVYNQEEIDRISKVKETNDKLEEFFNLKREEWTKNITPLFDALKDNFTLTNSNKIEVMDILGKVVYIQTVQDANHKVDLSNLNQVIYFYRVTNVQSNEMAQGKLVFN